MEESANSLNSWYDQSGTVQKVFEQSVTPKTSVTSSLYSISVLRATYVRTYVRTYGQNWL